MSYQIKSELLGKLIADLRKELKVAGFRKTEYITFKVGEVEVWFGVIERLERALECNDSFHRLGGIDDCEPCKARKRIEELIADNQRVIP